MFKPCPITILNALRRPLDTVDNVSDAYYAVKHFNDPAWEVKLELEKREIERQWTRTSNEIKSRFRQE